MNLICCSRDCREELQSNNKISSTEKLVIKLYVSLEDDNHYVGVELHQ